MYVSDKSSLPKKIYLIFSEYGRFTAYTFKKSVAKGFVSTRKGYIYKKAKTLDVYDHLPSYSDEVVEMTGNIFMTVSEEEWYNESFYTFISDIKHNIPSLKERIKCLKFTDEEIIYIEEIFLFMKNLLALDDLAYTSDTVDDVITPEDIIDQEESMRWFIENVIDE